MTLDPQAQQELAAGYVLGDLTSAEAEQFHQLMATDPSLQAEVTALQETLAMMPYGLTAQQPAVELRSRILTAMEQTQQQESSNPTPAPRSPLKTTRIKTKRKQTTTRLPWARPITRPLIWSSLAASFLLALGLGPLKRIAAPPVQVARPVITEQSEQSPETQSTKTQSTQRIENIESNQLDQIWPGFNQLLQDHRQALNNPEGPADFVTAKTSDILVRSALFQTTAADLPMLPAQKGKLLGSSNCEFGKTLGLRLSYQLKGDRQQIVSAYQLDLNGNQFPQFRASYITLRQPDGTGLVLWREESYLYALVAELPLTDLNNLAQSISRI